MPPEEVVDLISDDTGAPCLPAPLPDTSSCMFVEPACEVDTATSTKLKASDRVLGAQAAPCEGDGEDDDWSGYELVVISENFGVVSRPQ